MNRGLLRWLLVLCAHSIASALLLCTLLGCASDGPDGRAPDALPGMSVPTVGGQSGVEGGCGEMVGGGAKLASDAIVPGLELTPQQIAERAEASTSTGGAFQWRPWWLAPADAPASEGALSIAVHWLGTARALHCESGAVLDVAVQLQGDGDQLALSGNAELRAIATGDADNPIEIGLTLEADAPELAAKLALPPPAPGSADADRFALDATLEQGLEPNGWSGALSSLREGNACRLLDFPGQTTAPCDRYTPHVGASGRLASVALDSEVANGISAEAVLGEFDALHEHSLRWHDGTRTTVHVALEPLGFACTAASEVALTPNESGLNDGPTAQVQELLVPVRAHVTTEDGKLDVTLDGELSRFVSDNAAWDGQLSMFGMLTAVPELEAAGAHIDMPHDSSTIELFSIAVETRSDELGGHVALDRYAPYPGAPKFPSVVEDTSNRVSCFGALAEGEEAEIAAPAP